MTGLKPAEILAAWAPEGAPWSDWARPALFATMTDGIDAAEIVPPPIPWADALRASSLLVDLPGPESVATGLALAGAGFQPVPLFNGVRGKDAVVPTGDLAQALVAGAHRLAGRRWDASAPPSFLLDSRRMPPERPKPGQFDNRWITLPQDFSPATLLLSKGLGRALVVTRGAGIAKDLQHVLRRWQEGGVHLGQLDLASGNAAAPLSVPRPGVFRSVFYLLVALAGLRTANVGGFGGVVPHSSGGG